jgi:hypothetical protein
LIDGQVVGCVNDDFCGFTQNCVILGECSNDANYVCDRELTDTCDENLGDCVTPPSTCLGQTDCRSDAYAAPAATIAELPPASATLVAAIRGVMPDPANLTPTGPALAGATAQAKAWAAAHPDHQVVAVLATDGMPTLQAAAASCGLVTSQADIDQVVDIARAARGALPSISTFVIGVVGPDDASAPGTLRAIAKAGGSGDAFIVDTAGDVQKEFRAALNQIRGTGLSCDLAVPPAQAGKTVDYDRVNVDFTSKAGQKQQLSYVGDADGCAAAPGAQGWFYDVPDASQSVPTRIQVCPATCTGFKAADNGSVQISLGCKTRSIVK